MRRAVLTSLMALACSSAGSAFAQDAQRDGYVEQGQFKLLLDTSLVSWDKQVLKVDDYEQSDTRLQAGPFSGGGIGLGYTVTRYIVPQLYFSMQHVKYSSEVTGESSDGDVKQRQWEVRPNLEVELLPDSRFVPYVTGGVSLLGVKTILDDDDVGLFAVGPTLSLGLHSFLVEHAALDVSLAFRGLFIVKNDDTEDAPDDLKQRLYSILLNVGASFWM